jgi:hypothetical protein
MEIPKIATNKRLMAKLSDEHLKKFRNTFSDESVCLELLGKLKWEDGFVCSKCGNTNSCRGKSNFSRRCTKCKKEESVTAQTLFHRCKIPIQKAFEIAFLACNYPAISSYEISRQSSMRHMTCYKFQKKVQACKEDKDDDKLFKKIITAVNQRVIEQD